MDYQTKLEDALVREAAEQLADDVLGVAFDTVVCHYEMKNNILLSSQLSPLHLTREDLAAALARRDLGRFYLEVGTRPFSFLRHDFILNKARALEGRGTAKQAATFAAAAGDASNVEEVLVEQPAVRIEQPFESMEEQLPEEDEPGIVFEEVEPAMEEEEVVLPPQSGIRSHSMEEEELEHQLSAAQFFTEAVPNRIDFPDDWETIQRLSDFVYFLQQLGDRYPNGFPYDQLQNVCDEMCGCEFDFASYGIQEPHTVIGRNGMVRRKKGDNGEKLYKIAPEVMAYKFLELRDETQSWLYETLLNEPDHIADIAQLAYALAQIRGVSVEEATQDIEQTVHQFYHFFRFTPAVDGVELRREVPTRFIIPYV